MTDTPTGPIVIVRVAPDGFHLETGEGQALFYFVPYRENTKKAPVPWGSLWPVGIRKWILRWPPLLGSPQAGYGVVQRALGQQLRETDDGKPDEDYPGAQVTYQGWPLYLCNLTRDPVPEGVAGLWERASIDLQPTKKPDDLPTDPTRPFGGP